MQAGSRNSLRILLRSIAAVIAYIFLFNQMARAATPPRALVAAEAAHAAATNAATSPAVDEAQQPLPLGANSPEVEVRNRLQAAQKVYVTDAGTDANYPLDPSAGFNRFIATLQAWGRYKLVDTAADADLVLQFRNVTYTGVVDGTTDSPQATVYYEPEFRLTIADPQTLKPMWSFVLPVSTGISRKGHLDEFALSVGNVTSQLKVLAGDQLTPAENAALYPPPPRGRHLGLVLGIIGLAAVTTLPTLLFLRSKNHAEDQQHQFCVEHGLPC